MNIVFDTLKINNFLSLGKNITIDLNDQGFVLVKGQNDQSDKSISNGAGKSSIFDAIFWTITGETLRGTTDVVNEHFKKEGCSCELCFTINNIPYKIIRYRSHPLHNNSCIFYENDVQLSDQTKKSQEIINKTIPAISADILGSIVLLGQGLPYKFSSLSPIHRKELLESMSGSSTQLNKIRVQLDEEENTYKSQIDNFNYETIKLTTNIQNNETFISSLNSLSSETVESVKDEIHHVQEEYEKTKQHKEEAEGLVTQSSSTLKQLDKMIGNLQNFIFTTNSEKTGINRQIDQMSQGCCPTCGRPYDDSIGRQKQVKGLEEQYNQKVELLKVLDTKCLSLKSERDAKDVENRALLNDVTSTVYKINELEEKLNGLNHKLEKSQGFESQLKQVEENIRKDKITLYELGQKTATAKKYLDSIIYLKRQVSRDFKGYLLDEVIRFLSLQAEKYGKYLFTDSQKINVTLSGSKILISVNNRLYENLSGGERQRVDICVQFALRDMLAITNGFSCNLLVLDEIFDNLDFQGTVDVVSLIVSEFGDINSVFIITHHTDISIPYDKTLLVIKHSNGISEVGEES